MKVAVIGSRNFCDRNLVDNMMIEIIRFDGWTLVSGGASGVDSWAEEYADDMGWKKIIFKPDWDKHGKAAGFIRNKLIIDEADKVVAFWDGKSKGTKSSIDLAVKQNKPVDIYIRNYRRNDE